MEAWQREGASVFLVTNLRRDVFSTLSRAAMTSNQIAAAIGFHGNSANSIDRVLSWACQGGYATRTGTQDSTNRGLKPCAFQITEKGLAALAAMPTEPLRNARAKVWVQV